MELRRLRPRFLGLCLGLVSLFLPGCTISHLQNVPEEVHAVAVQPLATPEWKLKVKEQTIISLGERVGWKSRWKSCKLDINWKSAARARPFDIQCEGDECFATSGAALPGTFSYYVRAACGGQVFLHLDPDVVVME